MKVCMVYFYDNHDGGSTQYTEVFADEDQARKELISSGYRFEDHLYPEQCQLDRDSRAEIICTTDFKTKVYVVTSGDAVYGFQVVELVTASKTDAQFCMLKFVDSRNETSKRLEFSSTNYYTKFSENEWRDGLGRYVEVSEHEV